MKLFCLMAVLCLLQAQGLGGSLTYEDVEMVCKEVDYEYALTECDADRGQWRVQVPRVATAGRCIDMNRQPARRIEQCHISCEAGSYYELRDLSCFPCRPGTFSLGGGILLDSFQADGLPEGFTSQVETFRSSFNSRRGVAGDFDCNAFGWRARGGYLASLGGPCAATLTYDVHLVKPGNLTYTYQYPDKDVIFDFEAQNAQCQSIRDSKEFRWPQYTSEGEWKKQTVRLLTGQYVLQWKTLGMDHGQSRPVLIKSIEISGVSLTSPCVPCRPGTFSDGGARTCSECPEDKYSEPASATCRTCNAMLEYAPKGSPTCRQRLSCTRQDYYETRTPCDSNKETQYVYQWILPRICRDDLPGAAQLPPPSPRRACSPCNPGMDYGSGNGSRCLPCSKNTWSDGNSPCRDCPPGTTPNYSMAVTRWTDLPPYMNAACLQPDGSNCQNSIGWQMAGEYIHTTIHHTPDAYLLLSLGVNGFRSRGGVSGGRRIEVGRVEFAFELNCPGKCEFVFLQATESKEAKDVSVIASWTKSQGPLVFSYPVMQNDTYTFSWAFQRLQESGQGRMAVELEMSEDESRVERPDDYARIFNITVSNTVDGGASSCIPCHLESDIEGCIPCPPGQYVDANTTTCQFCPDDTTAVEPLIGARLGEEACQPCGPGLHSHHGGNCETNCIFDIGLYTYDLNSLETPVAVRGSSLFTASGAQYFHMFNISLCGVTPAECSNSVSYGGESLQGSGQVQSFVCRTTVIPGQGANEEEQTFSTQSVTLGDELVAVTALTSFMHMKVIDEFVQPEYKDIHFYYATPLQTRSCPKGRTTVISLRCDPAEDGNSTIMLPTQWPDGTSDGCNFNFLWKSSTACPICSQSDYKTVKGECVNRQQAVHYLPAKHCRPSMPDPSTIYVTCTTHIPVEIQLVVAVSVTLALMLCGCMMHFWRKTQSLEYKYMKLVQSSGGREADMDTELAPAESCALGEEDGEEEDVTFSAPNSQGLLNRIKAMRGKTESGNPFETVKLTK